MQRNKSQILTALLTGMLLALALACGETTSTAILPPVITPTAVPESPISTVTESEANIWLEAPDGDRQSGWASMWEEGDSLFVEIKVTPPEPVAQPAHIHVGDCPGLGSVEHTLENIVGGHSLSEFPGLEIADVATGEFAVNLHLSFDDFPTFTACGEIQALR